ncbi:MAG TPA: copper resistance CopC family protein [Aggregatilineales bacterium]|nr:copper resistance CopC family protein [Aggregatilineales bacterium]
MRWRWLVIVLWLLAWLAGLQPASTALQPVLRGVRPALAHALLDHSSPAANAILDSPPREIRLWFTEPLEPPFSHFELLDTNGQTVSTPHSQVDPHDSAQMFMNPGSLADGLYVVMWHSVSATDGHAAVGSFEFTIGSSVSGGAESSPVQAPIPLGDSLIRWFNLVSMALFMGGLGFWLFVWNAAFSDPQPAIERRMIRLIWAGWAAVGVRHPDAAASDVPRREYLPEHGAHESGPAPDPERHALRGSVDGSHRGLAGVRRVAVRQPARPSSALGRARGGRADPADD